MSRRVVIGILLMLIIGIVGGTVGIIMQRLGTQNTPSSPLAATGDLPAADSGEQQLASAGDEDNDGLPNAEEARWGSDPFTADTDGDGFLDGQEVQARHNPTVAGPNDRLPDSFAGPEGFAGGDNSIDLTDFLEPTSATLPADTSQPLNADLYFAEGVTLRPGGSNLTTALRARVGGEPTSAQVVQFVQAQPIQTALPPVPTEQIQVTENMRVSDIQGYLERIRYLETGAEIFGFRLALEELYRDDQTDYLASLITTLKEHRALMGVGAPAEAVQLHRMFLAYTQGVLDLTQSIVSLWSSDRVAALVAVRQLDAIDRKYAPLMQAEIQRIEQSLTLRR